MDFRSIINTGLTDDGGLERIKRGVRNQIENLQKNDGAGKTARTDNSDEYKNVAKEMESLFAYELLKVMRQTSEAMAAEKKGNGHNTYMSLFDMEISKLFAEKGMGLQDTIVDWLERREDMAKVIVD